MMHRFHLNKTESVYLNKVQEKTKEHFLLEQQEYVCVREGRRKEKREDLGERGR